jgi:hypothetical protein
VTGCVCDMGDLLSAGLPEPGDPGRRRMLVHDQSTR